MQETQELLDGLQEIYDFWKSIYYPNARIDRWKETIKKAIDFVKVNTNSTPTEVRENIEL